MGNYVTKTILPSISIRLQAIQNEIAKDNSVIVDVGCDHCLTAIFALKNKKAKFAYNIDIKKDALLNGVKGLEKYFLLSSTENFLADGLQTNLIDQKIDYCIISGLGSKNIASIVDERNKDIVINNFILLSNDNPIPIRKYLVKNNDYKIANEYLVYDEGYYYFMTILSKKGYTPKNESDIMLGKINLKNKTPEFKNYIQMRYKYLQTILSGQSPAIVKEYDLISKIIPKL